MYACNNAKSVLDILREEANVLRNNSKVLREEANFLRNNSKVLREEVKVLREEPQAIRNNANVNNTYITNNAKSELDILREEAYTLRNNSKVLRKEVNIPKNDLKKHRKSMKSSVISRKELNDNINNIDNTPTKIVKINKIINLQKDYILLLRDIEISLKKFIYERFLYPKF